MKIQDVAWALRRQYPMGCTTWGNCTNHDDCGNSARGSAYCADCCEKQLAELVGPEVAHRYHSAVKNMAWASRELEMLSEKLEREHG